MFALTPETPEWRERVQTRVEIAQLRVTLELLEHELRRDPRAEVFACGPPAMLDGVRMICAEHDVPGQLALESGMACGYGACFGCVVATRQGYVRLCVDGPVLAADALDSVVGVGV